MAARMILLPKVKLGEHEVDMCEELFIGDLVNNAMVIKDLRRQMKGQVLFITPKDGEMYAIKYAKGDMLKAVTAMQAKHGKDILILNTLPVDQELLAVYKKFQK